MATYKFEEIVINSTKKKKPIAEDKYTYIGLEHLDPKTLKVTRFGSEVAPKGEKLIMKKGDVLFGKRRAYQKKVAIAPFDGIFSAHGMVLRPNEEIIDKDFFPLFISSDYFLDTAINISVGSLSPTINWRDIRNLEFELPSLDKQRELAKVLWSMNETKERYKELLIVTDELVKSQFIEMFGTYKNSKYDVVPLDELCEIIKDGTHQTPKYTDNKEDGYKFLSSKDVTSGYIDWSNIKYIPSELHEKLYKRIAPRRNDILLAKNGTTGICAIVETDEIFDIYVSLALLRLKPGINIKYIWTAINLPETKEQFNARLKGIGVPNLHLGEIKKTKIVVPSLVQQNEFADYVQQSDKSKFELEQAIKELDATYKKIITENLV